MLQGFPRAYKFVRPEEPAEFLRLGRLIGNAVPPPLAEAIGTRGALWVILPCTMLPGLVLLGPPFSHHRELPLDPTDTPTSGNSQPGDPSAVQPAERNSRRQSTDGQASTQASDALRYCNSNFVTPVSRG